jgi:predicted nuclease with TOPRIM domain
MQGRGYYDSGAPAKKVIHQSWIRNDPFFMPEREVIKMTESEVIERLTRVEERSRSNSHRLDRLEPVVEEIHTMSETMVQLVTEVKHTNQNVAEIKEKVEAQEQRPISRLEQIKTAIIAAVASGLITGAIAVIFF